MKKIDYRSEIDGLRAIAVLAVVLYHSEFRIFGKTLFKGGFLGVDIFLVISGYLITLIILKDLIQNTFSFLNFYGRRIRRIVPMLLTVLTASIPFAWQYLLPRDMLEYSKSVLYALFFLSNLFFFSLDGYWAVANELKPLLHTWSLAIEEQFYFFVPILIFILWKYFGIKSLLSASVILFLVSLQMADYSSYTFPEFNFYMLSGRMWELIAGMLLAIIEVLYGRKNPEWTENILPTLGLFLIFHSIFFAFSSTTIHPSFKTLIPIAGTMLIIRFSSSKAQGIATKVLSGKLLVGIGLVSYGFYLWHYPIFAFGKIINENFTYYDKIVWIILAFILSIATYFLIETPFRKQSIISTKMLSIILTFFILLIISINIFVVKTNGVANRFFGIKEKILIKMSESKENKQYVIMKYDKKVKDKEFTTEKNQKIFLIGDSYSQDFYNMLSENNILKGINIIAHYINVDCYNVVASRKDIEKKLLQKHRKKCLGTKRIGDKEVNKKIRQSDGVILSSSWTDYPGKHILETVKAIKDMGIDNILVLSSKKPASLNLGQWRKLDKKQLRVYNQTVEERAINTFMKKQNILGYLDMNSLICRLNSTNKCITHCVKAG